MAGAPRSRRERRGSTILEMRAQGGPSRAAVPGAWAWLLLALLLAAPLPARAGSAPERAPAPAFALPTDGGRVSLESLRGRTVYVDFWASWCGPCRLSFPWLASLQQRYGGKGLAIVAINLDKDREAADAFLEKYPAPFTVAFDPGGKTAEAYKVAAMPSSFLIDSTGAVILRHAGFDPKKTGPIEEAIARECAK